MHEFDRDAFLDDLATFVGFETIVCRNPDEFRRVDEWVHDLLDGTGAEYTELDCHGLTSSIIRPPGSQRPALLGDGHVEVVPGPREMFTLDRRGSRAYGRGTADMKTAVLMMLWVLRDLLTSDDHHDFWLVLTEDEEVGSQGGAAVVIDHLVARDLLPRVALIPDGGHDFAYVEKEKGIVTAGGAHGRHEWVDVDSLGAYYELVHRTVRLVSERTRAGAPLTRADARAATPAN